ncbi:ankyrin repeat domain-containing protein 26-like [Nannospalax galili]|uniref:ankyrin repeat domain-containing protein 26-like n=1 Tax=Nannospalax galili TaxID=1026970 RepID=UPI0004ED26A8|nr:ankyrin repeat domain-containing protein 26-like [Nannospalax galili]
MNLLMQIDDVTAQVKRASLYLECLKGKHKLVQEKLRTMANEEEEKDIEEKLLLEKKLEQEVINLKTHIKENMIDKKDAEKHLQEVLQREAKKTFKEFNRILQVLQLKTEADRLEEQRRNDSVAALRTEMEGIVREKESELAKLKSEEASAITELETYKERYREQLKVTFSLRQKRDNIRKSIDQLQKDNARLLVENEQFRLSHRGNFY